LHGFLNVGTRFNDWVSRRISEYDFEKDKDFIVLKNEYGEKTAFQEYCQREFNYTKMMAYGFIEVAEKYLVASMLQVQSISKY